MRQTPGRIALDDVEALVAKLAAAVSARRLYAADHPCVGAAAGSLLDALRARCEEPFRLTTVVGHLAYGGVPIGTGAAGAVARTLSARDAGGLVIGPGLRAETLLDLLGWLAARDKGAPPPESEHVAVLPPGAGDALGEAGAAFASGDFQVSREIHDTASTTLQHIMHDLRDGRGVDFAEIDALARWAAEAAFSEDTALVAPAQLQRHDAYTFQHSVNVFLISTTLLQPFARDREELARFSQAALLHDVGKALVPPEILEKKGPLDDEELEVLRCHPEFGAEILSRVKHADPLAIEVAYCHHMRDGGLGYPTPALPVKPGPVAGVVQVADMFEALTAERPYKAAMGTEEAVATILDTPGMGSKRAAIGLLLQRLTSSPPGSEVRLFSGERAVVLKTFPDAPARPLVRVVEDADGRALAEPSELDLRETAHEVEKPIAEVFLKPSLVRTGRSAAQAALV